MKGGWIYRHPDTIYEELLSTPSITEKISIYGAYGSHVHDWELWKEEAPSYDQSIRND